MFTPTIIFYEGGGGWWPSLLSILLNSISIFCRDLHVSPGRSVANRDALVSTKKNYILGPISCSVQPRQDTTHQSRVSRNIEAGSLSFESVSIFCKLTIYHSGSTKFDFCVPHTTHPRTNGDKY